MSKQSIHIPFSMPVDAAIASAGLILAASTVNAGNAALAPLGATGFIGISTEPSDNGPGSGYVGVHAAGIAAVVAGGTITAGNPITSNASGQAIAYTGQAGYQVIGVALSSAVSGNIVNVLLQPALVPATTGAAYYAVPKIALVALTASDAAGGVFAWANPEATAIVIDRVQVDLTVVAAAACTLDIGTTAVSAGTLSDTLLDGIDAHAATGQFDNLLAANAGTNGKTTLKLAVGKWVTASMASGATAGLAGNAYIAYHLV